MDLTSVVARHFRVGSARHKGDIVVFEGPKDATFGRHVCQVSTIEGCQYIHYQCSALFLAPGAAQEILAALFVNSCRAMTRHQAFDNPQCLLPLG
jgi:hypothetical protein